MSTEKSIPIPDSGINPDNVLAAIDGVAGGLIDEMDTEKKAPGLGEPPRDTGVADDEGAAWGDDEFNEEAEGEELEGAEDDSGDEDSEGVDAARGKDEWQDFELEGSNAARVPFQLKVDKDGTRVYRFKAAERQVEVDEAEMIAGYQRQQDYNRAKNELVAREDQLLPYANIIGYAQNDPQFVQHIKSYFEGNAAPTKSDLQITDAQIREAMNEDPDEAATLLQRREAAREREGVARRSERAAQERWASWATRQRELVMDQFPDYDTVKDDLHDYLTSVGFTEQEISSQYDARMFRLAYDAYQNTSRSSGGRAPGKELKDKRRTPTPPKIIKAGAGKQSKVTPERQQRTKRQKGLFSRAMNTGTSEDWTSAIESLLPDDII